MDSSEVLNLKGIEENRLFEVTQYIKFEMPVLDSFVTKLKEEEEGEIFKLTEKYNVLKSNPSLECEFLKNVYLRQLLVHLDAS